jgi:hypothetical protein
MPTQAGLGQILGFFIALLDKAIDPFITATSAGTGSAGCYTSYNVDLSACGDAVAANVTTIIATGSSILANVLGALSAFSG